MSVLGNAFKNKRYIKRLEEPPIAKSLFGEVRWAWIWLVLRLYAGWQWVQAGWGKINNPSWTGSEAGAALTGFIKHALTLATGEHPAVQPFYA
jgi:thiosulfate dehydrogenase [quinone] large subunit